MYYIKWDVGRRKMEGIWRKKIILSSQILIFFFMKTSEYQMFHHNQRCSWCDNALQGKCLLYIEDFSPIVTSDELWVSRNLLRCCHTFGIQSKMRFRSLLRTPSWTSTSNKRRRKNRPRKPFTGSMWLAHKTHLQEIILYIHHYNHMRSSWKGTNSLLTAVFLRR